MNINVVTHPIVQDLITKLRNKETSTELYRKYSQTITTHLIYEALGDIKTKSSSVMTQTEAKYKGSIVAEKVAFVAILRAGLAMLIPPMQEYPNFEYHCVGIKRSEEDPRNTKPVLYLDRLDEVGKDVKRIVIVDPMFATGGTILTLVDAIKNQHKFKARVDIVCLISAKPGVEKLYEQFPDVKVTCAGFDTELNENAYIVPGLGDAGNRFFGVG